MTGTITDAIAAMSAQLQANRKSTLQDRLAAMTDRPRPDLSHLDDPGLWARIGMTADVQGDDGEVREQVKVVTAPTDPQQSLRLEDAARIAFPDGLISVASLRRELGARGLMHRIANKDLTTLADIEELKRSCRVQAKVHVSKSTRAKAKAAPECGISATDSAPSELDALKASAQRLKESLRSTSSKSTTPGQRSAEVIRMPSR